MSIKNPTLAHFRHFSHFSSLLPNFPSTNVENIRQIHPYLKKQTQFQKCEMMQAQYIQGIIKKITSSGHEKTNPIYRGSCLVEASAKMEALSEAGFVDNEPVSSGKHSCYNAMRSMYKILMINKEKS
ncbi:MAG: hypothetical protein GY845_27535 [Planctomycetes bacterium]|nr:hypothetical protein [Planctomycetota bacterium]